VAKAGSDHCSIGLCGAPRRFGVTIDQPFKTQIVAAELRPVAGGE
jgi:hypothetical protein